MPRKYGANVDRYSIFSSYNEKYKRYTPINTGGSNNLFYRAGFGERWSLYIAGTNATTIYFTENDDYKRTSDGRYCVLPKDQMLNVYTNYKFNADGTFAMMTAYVKDCPSDEKELRNYFVTMFCGTEPKLPDIPDKELIMPDSPCTCAKCLNL
jgi:hypothetical protein